MPSSSCRFPEAVWNRLQEATQEECTYRSELIRDAVLFYMAENPAGIRAFADVSHPARRRRSEPSTEEAETVPEGPYDPTEEM